VLLNTPTKVDIISEYYRSPLKLPPGRPVELGRLAWDCHCYTTVYTFAPPLAAFPIAPPAAFNATPTAMLPQQ
jgi:hypothetical protein